ncbi:MAG: elongation factor Ts [Candidatus Nomurabacteria bacterium GW2011_GWF2_43_8]|uniref:Elongation factor Ts n=3 Tax=Candidatus Nomuraibacteriota TaxID=1752729 RepID=A0A0G1HR99_9BACT|nr:MAG: elongation factor Ts [Candidatus Nomurabacteria bacterium GW2011_GWA2_43_15]KKT18463.1 MAG: elongation factor Ts [Candidatus Nomurabacteria bacterium GW2011_GWB1_43_7]KKT22097.1 MAG: elongation factor Ts [Candidatus Nomurabacteria bacterium GW2011_GWF2_43_8]
MPTQVTTEQVKELRDNTGISVMQCKRALEEADGDMKKALAILKKTSSDIALKKVNREVKDGRVGIKVIEEGKDKKAVLVSLLCETDFVARNEDFTNLLDRLSDKALKEGVEKMKAEAKDMIDSIIQKTGENIQLGEAYEVSGKVLGTYVHNNKIGVIVSLTGGSAELAKDIAMQVTALEPENEKALLEQEFIKDTSVTIGGLLAKAGAKIKEVKRCSI